MSTSPTISFIGAGNMASAIIGGMLDSGFKAANIWVSAPDDNHLQSIRKQFGVSVTTDNRYCAEQADMVVLAVKPQVMASVCSDIAPVVQNTRPLMVSIAAGLEASTLDEWLGGGLPLVRVMPNTPSLVGKGAAGLYANDQVKEKQKTMVESVFNSIGSALWVEDESLLHAVTALSGSGPAYFFLMLEALEEAATDAGIAGETARALAIQTMAGAAEMAGRSEHDPGQLKRNVMSPGGTTEQAIQTFEEGGMRDLVKKAYSAAYKRSGEMAKELANKQ
ncbi:MULTISPECIES: pyrroline-5-carboxylate reductase [Marinobacter]|uniref:Pyrroline-5-carboxylate reductase n=3 Tax=Bacteria TaxID=2 RepID=W5YNI9_9GAMM|nr:MULTISPECIES: pyrroline-5-carboxylate reductase [Marinobacter]AHI30792.1 pyrroline-5-carboxylate reductase [Marinobacter salarius]ARM85655.1 pyrroline-5-carboxylate reductase [Marinobacter salarius]KXJ42834.1 MAG: pyrroline-5-carboxylate reductase [Marinobacter sp. Hex_13]MAB52930.1 pyrroline-5-carboxylate reductase [Marinobacter sp.]MBJ7301097.1 pyrroline-5-carboxylate reductase [Marinobacter salarius]